MRQAVAADPKLRVLIVHGWNDLSCPFMGSMLTVDQMPVMGDPTRVAVREYPGGHMFYTREASRAELRKDVMEMYANTEPPQHCGLPGALLSSPFCSAP